MYLCIVGIKCLAKKYIFHYIDEITVKIEYFSETSLFHSNAQQNKRFENTTAFTYNRIVRKMRFNIILPYHNTKQHLNDYVVSSVANELK